MKGRFLFTTRILSIKSWKGSPELWHSSLEPDLYRILNGMNFPIDHLGIAVHNLEIGSAPYLALGFEVVGNDELVASQDVMVRAFQAGNSLIEF